jgi:hypothetical protein
MFKAHMFVGMLIIQHNMYQRKTAKTILEDLMELDTKRKYDFVIGINIKSRAGNDAFNLVHFENRVNNMRDLLNKVLIIDVELQNFGYDQQNELQTWDYTLGCLNITCFAVPRAPFDILSRPQIIRGNLQELMKTLYIVDYWVPFPSSEYGGIINVIASSDNEAHDLLRDSDIHYDNKYDNLIMQAVKDAIKVNTYDDEESRIVTYFTT